MHKEALIERLVRLGATDVPNTPRLLMRKRSPEELAALQHGVEGAFNKVQAPVQAAVDRAADKTFTPRIAGALKSVASVGIKNPEIIPMQAVPVPGLTPAYLAGKRGLEKLIDKVAPIAKHGMDSGLMGALKQTAGTGAKLRLKSGVGQFAGKTFNQQAAKLRPSYEVVSDPFKVAFSTNEYSGALNPVIPSQASHMPGFVAPNLQSPVQKRKQADMNPAALAALIGAGTIVVPEVLTHGGLAMMSKGEMTPKEEKAHKALFKRLAKGSDRKIRMNSETAAAGGGGAFEPNTGVVHMSEQDPDILAHELGHAELDKSTLGRLIQSHPARAAGGIAPLLQAIAGGVAAHTSIKGKNINAAPLTDALAIGLPTLAAIPTLAGEAGASIKGHRMLKEHEATPEELSEYRKRLLGAGMTYLAGPASGLGMYLTFRQLGKVLEKTGAGAPTRGNFMMASDLPSFAAPNLQSPIQKRSGASGMDEPNQPVTKVGDLDLAFDPAPGGKRKAAQLPGGLADKAGKELSDFPKKKLDEGEKVEHEHTSSHHLAREIAADHLTEDPKYYGKLKKMEKDGVSKEWVGSAVDAAKATPERLRKFMRNLGELTVKNQNKTYDRKTQWAHRLDDYAAQKHPRAAVMANLKGPRRTKAEAARVEKYLVGDAAAWDKELRLRHGLEKDSDMLPDFVTYNQGDFKRSKYAMPVEEMAKYVATLREKMAGAMGVSSTLGGASRAAKAVGAPKLDTPSIAEIAKPKGPGFGSGTAGAFNSATPRGSIGGRTPQALG